MPDSVNSYHFDLNNRSAVEILLFAVSVFWAMNMGASGLSASFHATYGSGILSRGTSIILFTACVSVGAVLVGPRVAQTIRSALIPEDLITPVVAVVILSGAAIALFTANVLRVPQSTTFLTVGSFLGTGLYFERFFPRTIVIIVINQLVLSAAAYFLTYFFMRFLYPPRRLNLRIYELLFQNRRKLALLSVAASCYTAFGIGTNNVPNVAGPLAGAGVLSPFLGLLLFSPVFGAGAYFFGRGVLEAAGKEIVPIGHFSAAVTSILTTSLVVTASLAGLPVSFVVISSMSMLAMRTVKDEIGHAWSMSQPVSRRIFLVWIITPGFAVAAAFGILSLLHFVSPGLVP